MKKIKFPLADVKLSFEDKKFLKQCLNKNQISSKGNYIQEFENKFSSYLGRGYTIVTSNGTTAIELALKTFNITVGDEVLVPNYSFAAGINAIINVGAIPVLCDINKSNFLINFDDAQKLITKKTKCLLFIHTFGQAFQLENLKRFIKKNKLILIQDCAESLGSKYKKKNVGLEGDVSTFSFYANKIITSGEGGAVNFKSKEKYKKALLIKSHGMSNAQRYWHVENGSNYRMTNLQASLLINQLKNISLKIKKRQKVFKTYNKFFSNLEKKGILSTPSTEKNFEDSYWFYYLKVKNLKYQSRLKIINIMKNKKIEITNGFFPISIMPLYKKYKHQNLINSIKISPKIILLPTYENLTFNEIKIISNNLINALKKIRLC